MQALLVNFYRDIVLPANISVENWCCILVSTEIRLKSDILVKVQTKLLAENL